MPEAMLLPGFGAPVRMVPAVAPARAIVPVASPLAGLRPYQLDAVAAIQARLLEHRSTLLVMATGLGKTQVFGAVAAAWKKPGRILVVAHREELLDQARKRLMAMTDEYVDLEQAEFRASGARIVVGSVQTLSRPKRLERFPQDAFELVIVDEAHHAVAATYKRVLDWFEHARVLGVTATPDRQDEKAMGQVFESVAYVREIEDGIRDGFLCPIRVTQVQVDAIDLAAVRTTAGDLNQGDLDAVMSVEEVLHGVVKPTMELAGERRTIMFTTSVANAHRMAEIFGRYRTGCARAVDGETPTDIRRGTLMAHKRGDFQFLVNVGVLTEGYDDPGVACVAMARPTKSRALYAQCAGRGLRIHPGKSDCLLLDFAGNSGRHRLVSALDILAGKYTDDEVKAAKDIAEKTPGIDAQEALEKAKTDLAEKARKEAEREAARRAAIKAKKVAYSARTVDPFRLFGVADPEAERGDWQAPPADPVQIEQLKRWGFDVPPDCTSSQAETLIRKAKHRRAAGLCTYKQARTLAKQGFDTSKMRFEVASNLIQALFDHNWRPPADLVASILSGSREVGVEG
ncbi:MAG TPA: DEAD/DEAH box helicase [Gemmatimonadales bacterium]|nr:DEAD/DEAH box helicase [Gemmatimonadales bacterium]